MKLKAKPDLFSENQNLLVLCLLISVFCCVLALLWMSHFVPESGVFGNFNFAAQAHSTAGPGLLLV